MINKEDLKKLIETHFHTNLDQDRYEVKTVQASTLLSYNRFDIAFKLCYLELLEYDLEFSKEIYTEHIRAFSLGKFTEPGNEKKNSIKKFMDAFQNIFDSLKYNDFNANQTIIPLAHDGSILNGAHRVASAIYLDKEVSCVQIQSSEYQYDYKFFQDRNVSDAMLDTVATKFIEYTSDVYIALIWPTAIGKDKELKELIPNIIYKKEVQLSQNGAHNLLSQIYYGETWLGSVYDDFRGSRGKLVECFKSYNPIRAIAFQAANIDEALLIKEKIRSLYSVGKHSLHITDTKEEAIRVARVLFNNNSIHFLNYAKPNKYISTHKQLDQFREFIVKNNLNTKEILLDSSIILSLYGLRESRDIDYLAVDNSKIIYLDKALEYHDEELKYHDKEKIEMIFNPQYYFYFNDVKFIAFSQLYRMKNNRAEEKDVNDCKMMEALIENNKIKEYVTKVKQNIYYERIKLRQKIIVVLQKIGLYSRARDIYRVIKSRK